jgi:hypothetical protein
LFPFLPDQTYGPYDVLNPKEIGWVIILTSGLGFVGYILAKFLGARKGILLGGIIGGLVSSTAVTWIYSKKSKENENIDPEAACQLADICNYLLDRYNDYPEKLKKLIIGAVRYVAISDDPFDDGTFATGFFDDMRIVNHVLEKLGIEDRYFTI